MQQLKEDYRKYYHVRAERYANNPHRKRVYQAESALRDAFMKIEDINAPQPHIAPLSLACAKALMMDEAERAYQFYLEKEEYPNAEAYKDHLQQLSAFNGDIVELTNNASSFHHTLTKVISLDRFTFNTFNENLPSLTRYIYMKNQTLSPSHHTEQKNHTQETWKTFESGIKNALADTRNYYPEAKFKWEELLTENRHRKKIFLTDEILKEYIELFKEASI